MQECCVWCALHVDMYNYVHVEPLNKGLTILSMHCREDIRKVSSWYLQVCSLFVGFPLFRLSFIGGSDQCAKPHPRSFPSPRELPCGARSLQEAIGQ